MARLGRARPARAYKVLPPRTLVQAVIVSGPTATFTFAAPAGTVSGGAVVTGTTANFAFAAPAGSVAAGAIIVQQVPGASQNDYGFSTTNLTTQAGNTLIVLAGWDLSVNNTDAAMPAVYVTDSAGNVWNHAGTSTSSVAGSRSAAWVCTGSRAVSWISVSLTSFATSLAYTILEVSGMPADFEVLEEADNGNPSAKSLAVNPGTLAAQGIAFSVFTAGSADAVAPSTPAGWAALTSVTSGLSESAPVAIFPFWYADALAGTNLNVTYTMTKAQPLSAVTFALAAAPPAPVQPNPAFPLLQVEAAFGFTPGDPSQSPPTWTDLTPVVIAQAGQAAVVSTMGRAYELASPEAGELGVSLDNHDGTFTPGNVNSVYYPDVVLGTPVRVRAYWAGQWYSVGYGYVERWPQQWPDLPQWGLTKLVATDTIAVLTSATMPSALTGDTLIDVPYVFIPCSEQYLQLANGVTTAGVLNTYTPADAQGLLAANAARVNQRAGVYVNGSVVEAATSLTTSMLGDAATGFGTTGFSAAPTFPVSGPGMIYTDPAIPDPVTGTGVSVEFWLLISATVASSTLQPVVFSAYGPASNYGARRPVLQVQVENLTGSNTLLVTLADGSTVSVTFNVSTNPQQVVLTCTPSALQVYVDGNLSASATLSAAQTGAWFAVSAGCPNYAYQSGSITAGNFTFFKLSVYPYILPPERVVSHYITGLSGQENVDATTRVAQVLSWGRLGIPRGGQVLFDGVADGVTQGPAYDLNGKTAADALNQVAQNHNAMIAGQPDGSLQFIHRWALFDQSPAAVFADNPLAGEIPFVQATYFDYDNSYLYNNTQITQQVGPNTTVTIVATDFTSEADYFTRSAYQKTIQTTSNLDAFDQANWVLAKYSQPEIRVAEVVVNAVSHPDAFGKLLALRQGQVAQVTRRPVGGATITETVLVNKIEHQIGPSLWTVTVQLSPWQPEDAVLYLDDPQGGGFDVLGNNTLA